MDQIRPEEISHITITPPAPDSQSARGWSVRAWHRENEVTPDEIYACSDKEMALNVTRKLLAGEKIALADCLAFLSRGGRPHATR